MRSHGISIKEDSKKLTVCACMFYMKKIVDRYCTLYNLRYKTVEEGVKKALREQWKEKVRNTKADGT